MSFWLYLVILLKSVIQFFEILFFSFHRVSVRILLFHRVFRMGFCASKQHRCFLRCIGASHAGSVVGVFLSISVPFSPPKCIQTALINIQTQ